MGKYKLSFRMTARDQLILGGKIRTRPFTVSSGFSPETIFDHGIPLGFWSQLTLKMRSPRPFDSRDLSVDRPDRPKLWIATEITKEQNKILGFNLPTNERGNTVTRLTFKIAL
jgi:hypothetical protein